MLLKNCLIFHRPLYKNASFIRLIGCSHYSKINEKKPETVTEISEEIYGRKRIYKNPQTINWQYAASNKTSFLNSQLRSMFLPINYPGSVHPCYLKFHLWQAKETYVGAFVGVLCSQAMLESLGLTKAAATAGAVAIQWVLKDGIAEIGKLLFIKQFSRSFGKFSNFDLLDSHPKTWKAFGEILTTLGSGLQMCTLLAPSDYFLFFAATGNILKSISWSIWGVTHTWFLRNFAESNNVGDLAAKAEAQSAFAMISGWMSGVCLLTFTHSSAALFTTYFLLAPLHALATYKLLKNAEMGTMNEAKAWVLVHGYVQQHEVYHQQHVQLQQSVGFLGESLRNKKLWPKFKLGCSIEDAFDRLSDVHVIIETIRGENYLIGFGKNEFYIVLHKDAEGRDSLKAMLNVSKLNQLFKESTLNQFDLSSQMTDFRLLELLRESHDYTCKHFPQFVAKLDALDWRTESVLFDDVGFRAQWKKLPRNDESIDLQFEEKDE